MAPTQGKHSLTYRIWIMGDAYSIERKLTIWRKKRFSLSLTPGCANRKKKSFTVSQAGHLPTSPLISQKGEKWNSAK